MNKKLQLHKETLLSLSDESLQEVAGGAATTGCTGSYATQTFVCPSGATWFNDCESTWVKCG
jgi:hypothetical protein